MFRLAALLLTVVALAVLALPVPASGQAALSGENTENLPARPIGPEDLLTIVVYGAPELSRSVRVSEEGAIHLPMLAASIQVEGMMPVRVEGLIAQALIDEDVLRAPSVTVILSEYHHRPISVVGAVRQPLTFPVSGKITLLEALARAQGLSAEAGSEVLVTRPGRSNGGLPKVERVTIKGLIEGADPSLDLELEGGDEVRVPTAGRVFVVGNVRKPGGFPATDGMEITVLKALAMAEGLAPFAKKQAYIYRRTEDPPGTPPREIVVELRKIMDRSAPDVPLGANDILYVQGPISKRVPTERYFHFDSWRVNAAPGLWIPSEIYIEEEGSDQTPGTPHFKAQTRVWDFNSSAANKLEELTSILVDGESGVKDRNPSQDASPLESQRSWEKQAEDNVTTRLERRGLLAPAGPADEVLNTVVNNLIVSAGLNVDAHCRVLLTTPIETFSIGHTIVISRGLIDVLPDETSLALVLAAELSHIALGHSTPTEFAFFNQTTLSDAELLQRFHFERSAQEMDAAAKKTIEIMRASPYQKTSGAGLFLAALAKHGPALPRLLAANLGNQVANQAALSRLAAFAASAPALDEDKIDQIAALPLGSRVKLNPWNDQIELVKTRPLALLSAREKMPFEVTPFVLHLVRVEGAVETTNAGQ